MTTRQFNRARSDAIRRGLAELVERQPSRRRRGLPLILACAAGALAAGGAVSATAASGILWPVAEGPPLPGGSVTTVLGDGFTVTGQGTTDVPLPPVPREATHLQVEFTCLSGGSFTWGTDPTNNPGSSCSGADIEAGGGSAAYSFALTSSTSTFYIATADDSEWRLTARFADEAPTEFGVNANGETFGVEGPAGTPDLIAVVGTDDEGRPVDGYARASDFEEPMPSSPEEALRWQAEREAMYPDGRPVAVYESNGETRIGTFIIG